MKLSDQLRLLLEMEDRVAQLERVVFGKDVDSELSRQQVSAIESKTETPKKVRKKKPPNLKDITLEEFQEMSTGELVSIAKRLFGKNISRQLPREQLVKIIQKEVEAPKVDPLQSIRESIYDFIWRDRPGFRLSLSCSKDCVGVCPQTQVVYCWANNKKEIQEIQ